MFYNITAIQNQKGPDNHEPHIAIANIKERLEFMCNGDLIIKSKENGGTRVIINI